MMVRRIDSAGARSGEPGRAAPSSRMSALRADADERVLGGAHRE